jgi:hypothetical protein
MTSSESAYLKHGMKEIASLKKTVATCTAIWLMCSLVSRPVALTSTVNELSAMKMRYWSTAPRPPPPPPPPLPPPPTNAPPPPTPRLVGERSCDASTARNTLEISMYLTMDCTGVAESKRTTCR